MRKILVAMVLLAFVAVPANGYGLRLFYDLSNDGAQIVRDATPTAAAGQPVYMWAEMLGLVAPDVQHWNMVSVNIEGLVTPSTTLQSALFYNNAVFGTPRWQSQTYNGVALPTQSAQDFRNFYVDTGHGVTNKWGLYGLDTEYYDDGAGHVYILLGEFTFSGFGGTHIGVGNGGIVRSGGGGAEPVYFGFGDEADGLDGDDFLATSTLFDAFITPEPASLILLGLGALALRRR